MMELIWGFLEVLVVILLIPLGILGIISVAWALYLIVQAERILRQTED